MNLLKYVILISPILLSSCVSLITASSGEVTITDYQTLSKNENLKISYGNFKTTTSDHEYIPLTDSVISDVNKLWGLVYKIEDKNHLTQYVLSDRIPSRTRFLDYGLSASLLGLAAFTAATGKPGLVFGTMFILPSSVINSLYTYRYISEANSKETSINYIPRKFPVKGVEDLFLQSGELSFETNQIRYSEYRNIKCYNNEKLIKQDSSTFQKGIKLNNQTELFESIIDESGFTEKNVLLQNSENHININASILIWHKHSTGYNGIVLNEFLINWEFTDIFTGEVLMSVKDSVVSDFMLNGREFYNSQIRNGLEKSLIKILSKNNVTQFLKKENHKSIDYKDQISIETSGYATTKGETLKSSVTLKGTNKQGSGFIISKDGYMLSNYHVVGNNDTVQAIMYDGTAKKAKVIRVNKKHDLALLKIDVSNHMHVKIETDTTTYNNLIGQGVYVIGTSLDSSLGQSISNGMVSGTRKFLGVDILQTNASINSGNSGGPLILESGEVVGIVNSKLNGEFVEGVGFAIPIWSINKALNINISYK